MNTRIEFAMALIPDENTTLAAAILPPGFPFLVSVSDEAIVEPVLHFLTDTALQRHSWVRNTAVALANDLKDWWDFLSHRGIHWDEAEINDIKVYRDAMCVTVSPSTHRPYAIKTVRRRLGTVVNFYRWANREGLCNLPIDGRTIQKVRGPIDNLPLAHLSGGTRTAPQANELFPRLRGGPDDFVRPLTFSEYQAVATILGPLPSEREAPNATDTRSSRDRLACDLSLATGMRVNEVASLTLWQIEALTPDPDAPMACCALWLTKTKGLVKRRVLVPNWLVIELQTYAAGERASCARGRKIKTLGCPSFFVNKSDAKHNAGAPTRAASLQTAFRKAILQAGLVERELRIDPENREEYARLVPRHSFHDLRHSFAAWMYVAEKAQGNPEPWKFIQSLLGHKHLSTTLNIYLRLVDAFEAQVSNRQYRHFQEIRLGHE